jgi:hypothetical protein
MLPRVQPINPSRIDALFDQELDTELLRFIDCREPANVILWQDGDLRQWKGKGHCGDVTACWDGRARIRLCGACAKSPWLKNWTTMLAKMDASRD